MKTAERQKEVALILPKNLTEEQLNAVRVHEQALEKEKAGVSVLRYFFGAEQNLANNTAFRDKVRRADEVHILLDLNDGDTLFYLGVTVSAGKKIVPIGDLQETDGKSFQNVMLDNFKGASPVGLYGENTNYKKGTEAYKAYICCSVRGANDATRAYVDGLSMGLRIRGVEVHSPPQNTDQVDSRGWGICGQNGQAIADADMIYLVYDPGSKGSRFDLGIAFERGKPLTIVNPDVVQKAAEEGDNFAVFLLEWAQPSLKKQLELLDAAKTVKRK
ncbi:MAG: hypothetical protein KGH57_04530 [Candidatus Micrarchaeota archaeon]|nr:hypothetical protein [Candidatus Micrarchaeota archaeon]